MTTTPGTPEMGEPAPKAVHLVSLAVSALAVGVLVWVMLGRPPLRLVALRGLMGASQNTARAIGSVGIAAEAAYRKALDETSLS